MKRFIELPTALVREEAGFPPKETSLIYEHLKYFLSRPPPSPLPAIAVIHREREFIVVGGHEYLRIAKELGRPTVRAMIDADPRSLPTEARLIPLDVLQAETETKVAREYHVYFFATPLSAAGRARFRTDIAGFFERLQSPLLAGEVTRVFHCEFPFEGRCGEFEALIPLADSSWYAAYLQTAQEFSRTIERIISFQGRRFPSQ